MRLFGSGKRNVTVGISMRPAHGPWGGSSVFVHQFERALKRYGFDVTYRLGEGVDLIVIVDPREDLQAKTLGLAQIRAYKKQYPHVKVLHRINECDKRKNTHFMDGLLEDANKIADHTVFISSWLRGYFIERWFDPGRPHEVIYNGADPTHFHPVGSACYQPGRTMRVVTHHWSDNPMKGFPVYKQLDNMIADGELEGFELWIIGRWPKEIRWRAAKTFPPATGTKLADLLRQCHLYITASLWEPCGMHHIEGAQCGLPLVYHEDGGGIVEAGRKYGIGFRDDLKGVLLEAKRWYVELKDRVLNNMPSGEKMISAYLKIIQSLTALR